MITFRHELIPARRNSTIAERKRNRLAKGFTTIDLQLIFSFYLIDFLSIQAPAHGHITDAEG
jgi:hypothetical protein